MRGMLVQSVRLRRSGEAIGRRDTRRTPGSRSAKTAWHYFAPVQQFRLSPNEFAAELVIDNQAVRDSAFAHILCRHHSKLVEPQVPWVEGDPVGWLDGGWLPVRGAAHTISDVGWEFKVRAFGS